MIHSKSSHADADSLAARVRAALPEQGRSEQRMFGGIGFMLNGNMIVGSSKRGLLLRVGKERYRAALERPGARPMEMRGRQVEGYIVVETAELSDAALHDWLECALALVRTLPAKPRGSTQQWRKGDRK